MNIAIYLAGSIKKAHERSNESYWTEGDLILLRSCLQGCQVSFLNPAFRTDDLSDQHSVFGRDMLQVFCSDYVFVDARDRRGLGVGAEMMWAKFHRIPVIAWAPKNSHYHKAKTTILDVPVENFIHPFVEGLSDKIVENLQEAAQWILEPKSQKIKGPDHIQAAMQYYKAKQLPIDTPMKKLMELNENLSKKIQTLKAAL